MYKYLRRRTISTAPSDFVYCQSPCSRFRTLTLNLTVQRSANENTSFLWPGDGFVFSILKRMGPAVTPRRGWASCCCPLEVFRPVLAARPLVILTMCLTSQAIARAFSARHARPLGIVVRSRHPVGVSFVYIVSVHITYQAHPIQFHILFPQNPSQFITHSRTHPNRNKKSNALTHPIALLPTLASIPGMCAYTPLPPCMPVYFESPHLYTVKPVV